MQKNFNLAWRNTSNNQKNLLVQNIRAGKAQLIKKIIERSNLIKHMSENDFKRTYVHPEYNKQYTLGEVVQLYAWHGMHHTAQIEGIFK